MRSFLQDVLGFVQHQENAPFGLGYKLAMKRNIHCTVFSRAAATTNGKDVLKIIINMYTLYFKYNWTRLLSDRIVTKIPAEMSHSKESVFFSELLQQQIACKFELGVPSDLEIPVYPMVCQKDIV